VLSSPTSVEDALEQLARPGATALAGGMSLMPAIHLRDAAPRALVSLSRIPELVSTHARLAGDPLVARHCTVLARAARGLADVQVRNRGTLGGSLANAHPGAEAAIVLAALGAGVEVRGGDGARVVPAEELIVGAGETVLASGELIVAVTVPYAVGAYADYLRCSRIQGNYSTVNAAAVVDGERVRVCLGGVLRRPVVVEGDDVAEAVRDAYDDHHASAAYRRALAGVLARRVVASAIDHPYAEEQ
jgi:carbon-monoxide dehydrogenase medium subunit